MASTSKSAAGSSSSAAASSSSFSVAAATSSSAVASSSSSKVVVLMSMEGERFEVEDYVARESKIISNMMEDDCANNVIPVPNVMASILSKMIEWCKKHAQMKEDNNNNEEKEKELRSWDKEFVDLDTDTLYHLLVAANYLEIKGLLDLLCQRVADMIKGKSPEQIREVFNIKNDFTPEEEEAIRKENSWAFESA